MNFAEVLDALNTPFSIPDIWKEYSPESLCTSHNTKRSTKKHILTMTTELNRKLLYAYSAPPQTQEEIIQQAFYELEKYPMPSIKELAQEENDFAYLIRQYNERATHLLIKHQIQEITKHINRHTASFASLPPALCYFGIGTAFPNSLIIETRLQNSAAQANLYTTEIQDMEDEIQQLILHLEKQLIGCPTALIYAIQTYHQKTLDKIYQAILMLTQIPEGFYSLQHLFSSIIENTSLSPYVLEQISKAIETVQAIEELIENYTASLVRQQMHYQETEQFIQQYDHHFILYLAKYNSSIYYFLKHPIFSHWLNETNQSLLTAGSLSNFNYIDQDSIHPLDFAIATCNWQLYKFLAQCLSHAKNQEPYKALISLTQHLQSDSVDPINLQHIIHLHEEARQALKDAPGNLIPDFFEQSPLTQEIIELHGTPALINQCINHLTVAYCLYTNYKKCTEKKTAEQLRHLALLSMCDALYDLYRAQNREKQSLAAINNLTSGSSLSTFFKRYIPQPPAPCKPIKINSWQNANKSVKKQIKTLFNISEEDLNFTTGHLQNKAAFAGR